jgi:ATP-dependent RNA helicase SUPV3L1/SUV3
MLPRAALDTELAALSQEDRAALRKAGLRFGRAAVYLPALLKPRPARLHALLAFQTEGRTGSAYLPPPGLTSFDADPDISLTDYARAGFQVLAGRAVRLDILDRVADALYDASKAAQGPAALPQAAVSLLGASNETTEAVVAALGWEKMEGPEPAEGETRTVLWRPIRQRPPRNERRGPPDRKGQGSSAQRTGRTDGGASRPERRPDRPGRPDRPDRPADGRRPDGGFDRNRTGRRGGSGVIAAGPSGSGGGRIDPSSPFAVLAALKPPPPPPRPATSAAKSKRERQPVAPEGSGTSGTEAAVTVALEPAPVAAPAMTGPVSEAAPVGEDRGGAED